MDKPRVIISVRVSSRHQQEQGFGHANQIRRLPQLVAEQGWDIANRPDGSPGIYDEGYASTTATPGDDLSLESRPVMQQLLAELRFVEPTYVVCREIDRLHRDTLEWELMQHQLVRAGVEGIVQWPTLQGMPMMTRLDESKDRAFASIQAVFASLQKADLKAKTAGGRRERAAQGLPYGGVAPFGYDRPISKGPYVVNQHQTEAYSKIMDWAIEGHGAKAIATRLTRSGVPTPGGGHRWVEQTVGSIIASKAPLGMTRDSRSGNGGWIPARDQPAIITQERWEQAQAVVSSRKTYSDNRRKHVLAGLLRCSDCGRPLRFHSRTQVNRSGKRYSYPRYECSYNRDCTGRHSISEPRAVQELAVAINERLRDTSAWFDPPSDDTTGQVEDRIAELETAIASASSKVKRAHTAWIDADDDMAAIALEELQARRQALKKLEEELAQERAARTQASQGQLDPVDLDRLRTLLHGWETLPDANHKRRLLESVIRFASVLPRGRERRLEIHWVAMPDVADIEAAG
jgi:DNA invertase Pin-like site-specific DNA recombinase